MRDLFSDLPDSEWNGRADQFALTRLQLYNWGTFSELHTIEVAPEGHLFTGASGSGKSTLLDAHAALVTPLKWKDYNVAAAQEGERKTGDRTDLSYVRGAWAQQTGEEGDLVSQFLRAETTWSAIAETYRNGRGAAVVLCLLLWVRGRATANTDVQRRYFVLNRQFNIKELLFFPQSDFDVRRFKTELPDVKLETEFSAYGERFRGLLGIEEELALKLLHKTQSAKNLGDLNVFLRDFMLDPPETFAIRDRLVQEFQTLKDAHEHVVRARQQIEVLEQARTAKTEEVSARADHALYSRADEVIPEFFDALRRRLFVRQKQEAHDRWLVVEASRDETWVLLEQAQQETQALLQKRDGVGGRQLADWEREIGEQETRRDRALKKRPQVEAACSALGVEVPRTLEAFTQLKARSNRERENDQQERTRVKSVADGQQQALGRAGDNLEAARRQVEEWSRRKTLIDTDLQRIRDNLVRHLRCAEEDLPFVGELLEVLPEETAWRGTIERVLAGAAVTLLVPQKHFAAVRDYVDATHLGNRLRYETEPQWSRAAEPGPLSLIRKLNVKSGSFHDWIENLLLERFDYACVETPAELTRHTRAVTKRGQIKQNSWRYEKNDRHEIDNQQYWSLGFDNRDKVRLFEAEAQRRAQEYSELQTVIQRTEKEQQVLASRSEAWSVLGLLEWDDVDASGPAERIARLHGLITQFREQNAALADLDRQLDTARTKEAELSSALRKLDEERGALSKTLSELETKLFQLGDAGSPLSDDVLTLLAGPDTRETEPASEDEINRGQAVARRASQERLSNVEKRELEAQHRMETQFREFLSRWNEFSGDLKPEANHADEFLALLDKLVGDGLPKFEKQFLDLLTEQSDNNLTLLNTQLDQERRAIRGRLSAVNEGLKDARFNHDLNSYLVIHIKDRQLRDVAEFRQRISDALGYSLGQDLQQAESRFESIDSLVADIGSSDPEKTRWQKQVLDVRQHVEFVARELSETDSELNVYPSGAGKSGGQRQLLSAAVLAAALRYQLGGKEKNLPRFRTVVLDEAFDKADADFTRSALRTFQRLGFQLILATPGKSLETIQTFVGGGSVISIQEQKFSRVVSLVYETAEKVSS